MFAIFASILLLSIHYGQCHRISVAQIYLDGTNTHIGSVTFQQSNANLSVHVWGTLTLSNLTGTAHGFHVHTVGVTETFPNCTAALGHFNPLNTSHGPREADIMHRHVGDLGNLTVDANGTIKFDFNDTIISLYDATRNITNRTVIIHQMLDDGGDTGVGTSSTTGNAGVRVACGFIKNFPNESNSVPDNDDDSDSTVSATSMATSAGMDMQSTVSATSMATSAGMNMDSTVSAVPSMATSTVMNMDSTVSAVPSMATSAGMNMQSTVSAVPSMTTSAGVNMTTSVRNSTTSHGLNIQPTVSVLFLTAITALLMFFY